MNRELGWTSKRVYDALGGTPRTARAIADELGMTVSQVNGGLRTLLNREDVDVQRISGSRPRAPVHWFRGDLHRAQPAYGESTAAAQV